MNKNFEMVAKTMQGLEDVLAEELRSLGAKNVEPGRRMVSFEGDLETLYRANICCRTALRILKPISKFIANDPDTLYSLAKEFDWGSVLSIDKTFAIDPVVYSDTFTHSRYVTYRVKDAIVDWFRDRLGPESRPGVRLTDADVIINVHIAGDRVTLSLDSSGESLHKRGYRTAQTEAPINEVLAAGILLKSGYRGDTPLVDPMCGSGTFLIEAALIAANINPGIYRRSFAFENWRDFDAALFERIFNDDSAERTITQPIMGADISPKAVAIARQNIKSAGVAKYIDLECRALSSWDSAPEKGILVTNPPYGERISADNMEALYALIGEKLKHTFTGYHAWIIAYRKEYMDKIGLAASSVTPILNGSLECELREYVIFDGDYRSFRSAGGTLRTAASSDEDGEPRVDSRPSRRRDARLTDAQWRRDARNKGFGGKQRRTDFPERRREPRALEQKFTPKNGPHAKKFRANPLNDDRDPAPRTPNENPLALRRNPRALDSITGKTPELPGAEPTGRIMRARKGWRRPGEEDK